ncbi:Minf_1886 family protein [Planctomycetota bacterium]
MKKTPEEVGLSDGRYVPAAFQFVYEGLGYTVKDANPEEPHHVNGQTLCDGLRRFAIEKWGRMAICVLSSWNVKTTRDFGEIVYSLIEHEWMSAQPGDTIDDFNDVFDFQTVFKEQFSFSSAS